MRLYVRGLQGGLNQKMQLLTSQEADFGLHTWTFHAPSFVVTGGDYLVISRDEWNRFWDEAYECESARPSSPEPQPAESK